MNDETKKNAFKEENDNNILNNQLNPQERAKLLKILIEKYDLTPETAEKTLTKIVNKTNNETHNKNNSNESENLYASKPQNSPSNGNQQLTLDLKENNDNNAVPDEHNQKEIMKNKLDEDDFSGNKQDFESQKMIKQENQKSETNLNQYEEEKQDVDKIISDIIPNYNKQTSIELNHVDLTFEVDDEKIDTIKEKVISILKNNKPEKIRIHALNDVSFTIQKGEKIGIIGYNGAGKSTLLKVITGIYHPDKGTVKTYGNISPLLSLGAGFDYNYSGRKNILLNGAVLGYSREFLEEKIDEIIEFSELGRYIDIPIKNYSSGMLSKLGFSIATILNPDILIIDEILGVGDVNFKKKSSDKIRSLMDGGTTVLIVSHSIPQIRELCDKAIWIDDGKLREMGEVNEVCDHYLEDAEKASNEQLKNIQFK